MLEAWWCYTFSMHCITPKDTVDVFHLYLHSVHFLFLYFCCKHMCRRPSLDVCYLRASLYKKYPARVAWCSILAKCNIGECCMYQQPENRVCGKILLYNKIYYCMRVCVPCFAEYVCTTPPSLNWKRGHQARGWTWCPYVPQEGHANKKPLLRQSPHAKPCRVQGRRGALEPGAQHTRVTARGRSSAGRVEGKGDFWVWRAEKLHNPWRVIKQVCVYCSAGCEGDHSSSLAHPVTKQAPIYCKV